MKTIALILATMGLASAGVIPVAPLVANVAPHYHAQADFGQYSYGYQGAPVQDEIAGGGYAYVDGNGLARNAAYFVDPVSGFRVAATNVPVGPAIAIAPASAAAPFFYSTSSDIVAPAPSTISLPSEVIQSEVPSVSTESEAPAPVVEETSEEPSAPETLAATEEPKPEEGGLPQSAQETDSPTFTDLQQRIIPVQDTPEVQAAKEAHLAAFEEVKMRDMEQNAQDAQENFINSASVIDQQPEETSDAAPGSTEAPSPQPTPLAESSLTAETPFPASAQIPSKAEIITPSVVATELAPAVSPVELREGLVSPVAPPASVDIVPAVLTKQVVAAPIQAVAPATIVSAPAATIPLVVFNSPVAPSPSGPVALEHVGQITSQYHAQDEFGQYVYGYSGGPSAKHEVKTADGLTNGGYSYIDSHGLVQSAAYVSDPVNGFRVVATNIPKNREPEYIPDSPDVEEAKQKLFQAQAEHIAKL